MATRFYSIGTLDPKIHRTHRGPGLLFVGALTSENPTALPGTMVSLGLTGNAISIAPNIESDTISSAQMFNPYKSNITGWGYTASVELHQIDPFTIAVAFGLDIDASVSGGTTTTLDGQCPSPYRAMRIDLQGPSDTGNLTAQTMSIEFYKSRWLSSGEMAIDPENRSALPIEIMAFGNNNDVAGRITNTESISDPGYE